MEKKLDNLLWGFGWVLAAAFILATHLYSNIIALIGLAIGLFLTLHHFFGPTDKNLTYSKKLSLKNELLKFFDNKISQGEKLYKSDLSDKVTLNDDFETYTHPVEFSEKYLKWKNEIAGVFENAYIKKIQNRFTNPRETVLDFLNQNEIQKYMFGPYRPFLLDDLTYLKAAKEKLKSDMLNENYDPQAINEYL